MSLSRLRKNRFAKGLIALSLGFLLTAPHAFSDDTWYPSKYGANDTIGAANNMSPKLVVKAAKLVKTGKTYSLGVVTDKNTPSFGPRSFNMTIVQPSAVGGISQVGGGVTGDTKMVFNDDILHTWLGIGTQIDGLGHVGIDYKYYNGKSVHDFVDTEGLKAYGTETIPPIVSRGIVLDIAGYKGVDMMSEGDAINVDEIKGAAKRQGVKIKKGDVVLLHTGWLSISSTDPERFISGEPGLGMEGSRYLADKGVVAIGSDSWALEVIPFEEGEGVFGVHQELLAKHGVYILENVQSKELVEDKAWEFLFVLGQPKFAGAVQMVINPIAIR